MWRFCLGLDETVLPAFDDQFVQEDAEFVGGEGHGVSFSAVDSARAGGPDSRCQANVFAELFRER